MFVPEPKRKGYSYLEDGPRDVDAWLSKNNFDDIPPSVKAVIKDGLIDSVLKSKFAPQATRLVQKGVYNLYAAPGGKLFVNSAASVSLAKPVYGAAAISHVSKTMRTHGITTVGTMLFNDGELLVKYARGKIDGTTLVKGVLGELVVSYVEAVGWMMGASIAATIVLGPVGATAVAYSCSSLGRFVGSWLASRL